MRHAYVRGRTPCRISRLKPVIDPAGNVFPCCGVQYATDEMGQMPAKMSMGHWREWDKMAPFDGSVCKRCYYSPYNDALDNMVLDVEHQDHV